jgi:hypothetical protein
LPNIGERVKGQNGQNKLEIQTEYQSVTRLGEKFFFQKYVNAIALGAIPAAVGLTPPRRLAMVIPSMGHRMATRRVASQALTTPRPARRRTNRQHRAMAAWARMIIPALRCTAVP